MFCQMSILPASSVTKQGPPQPSPWAACSPWSWTLPLVSWVMRIHAQSGRHRRHLPCLMAAHMLRILTPWAAVNS